MHGTRRLGRTPPPLALALGLVLAASPALLVACGGESPPPTTPSTKASSSDPASPAAPASAAANDVGPSAGASGAPVVGAAGSGTGPSDGAWPRASFTPDERSAQLERLKKDPGPIKSNWVPPGKADRYGHAEGLVTAPLDAVRSKLVDFGHYKDLAGPKFKSVKVVDKQGDATDVYFQLPIMKGVITLWYVTRFTPARSSAGGDVVEGTYVKGNIKGMHIAFTVRPGTDDKSSVMVCDLVLQPNVPAPQGALDEELRDACGDAINSLRRTMGLAP